MSYCVISRLTLFTLIPTILMLSSCGKPEELKVQGYIEGRLTFLSSPRGGKLVSLNAKRGDWVGKGDLIYALDNEPESFEFESAQSTFLEFESRLRDLEKGSRPSEIDALEAQIHEAEHQLRLAEVQLERRRDLLKSDFIDQESVDVTAKDVDVLRAELTRLKANLVTARLGGREDAVQAADAAKEGSKSKEMVSLWNLEQKKGYAPEDSFVFDTYYRMGEYVASARPIVGLLDPKEIKAFFYISEEYLSSLNIGDSVEVIRDGSSPVMGRIVYVSPEPEYTPPIIYSNETRSQLVYKIEAAFDVEVAKTLHPGQPIEVLLDLR